MDTVKLHDGSLTVLEKTGGDTTVLSRGKMWGGAWLASTLWEKKGGYGDKLRNDP